MSWYVVLLVATLLVFLLKTILSWAVGETEWDLDLDGEPDIDLGSMISFKGVLHFLMGFSAVLTSIGYEQTHSFDVTAELTVMNYVSAVIIGMVFMVALFYVYKLIMGLNNYETDEIDLDGLKGRVYLKINDLEYDILVDTPMGTYKKRMKAFGVDKDFIEGDVVVIVKDRVANEYRFRRVANGLSYK